MNIKQLPTSTALGIVYSRYESRQVSHEACVAEHGTSYIVAGSLRMADAGGSQVFSPGSLLFYRKNFLAKFIKQPAKNGPFLAITVVFDATMLLAFSQQHGVSCDQPYMTGPPVITLDNNPILQHFYNTLRPYFEEPLPEPLAKLRQEEALRLLLQTHPTLRNALFNFGQPGKIDLEAFMRQNFRFNVELKQLAYLTGRSLATFKRDFDTIFHTSPTRWLYRKRLEEAYYLIKEENQRPSDVYYEVGFESLAHFSYAFKKFFGSNPSRVHTVTPTR